ncbi:MAG: nucleotide pyrophosphohydrolase [Promethearchaeota archaeon]
MSEINSLKSIQKKIDKFIKNHGGYWPPLSMLSAVMEEVGELAREINCLEGFKPKKSTERQIDIGEELGDIIFAIVCLANYYNIDLSEKINQIINKYQKRDSTRFI